MCVRIDVLAELAVLMSSTLGDFRGFILG